MIRFDCPGLSGVVEGRAIVACVWCVCVCVGGGGVAFAIARFRDQSQNFYLANKHKVI